MEDHTITIKGDRDLWLDFMYKVKKEKKRAWDILELFIKKYLEDGTKKL